MVFTKFTRVTGTETDDEEMSEVYNVTSYSVVSPRLARVLRRTLILEGGVIYRCARNTILQCKTSHVFFWRYGRATT